MKTVDENFPIVITSYEIIIKDRKFLSVNFICQYIIINLYIYIYINNIKLNIKFIFNILIHLICYSSNIIMFIKRNIIGSTLLLMKVID